MTERKKLSLSQEEWYVVEDELYETRKNEDPSKWNLISKKISDQTRWTTFWTLILSKNGEFFETTFGKGSTESQDYDHFDYEGPMILSQVFPVTKTVTVYE